MSYHPSYTQSPTRTVQRHESHNFEKIGLCLLLAFGLTLIAIACHFFYEFLSTYKKELNTTLYVFALLVTALGGLLLLAFVLFIISMLWLKVQEKRAQNANINETFRAKNINNRLADAIEQQINDGLIYLSEQVSEQGKVKFKSLSTSRSSSRKETEHSPILALPDIKNSLLVDLMDCQRLLLTGGSGAGKTSVLLHIAQERVSKGELLILDSNGFKGKWGNHRVVGLGYPSTYTIKPHIA